MYAAARGSRAAEPPRGSIHDRRDLVERLLLLELRCSA
jgi:hypothetical protein